VVVCIGLIVSGEWICFGCVCGFVVVVLVDLLCLCMWFFCGCLHWFNCGSVCGFVVVV